MGSLLDNYENKCMPVFDYDESDNPNTLFWNETRRFQRKLKRYDKVRETQKLQNKTQCFNLFFFRFFQFIRSFSLFNFVNPVYSRSWLD